MELFTRSGFFSVVQVPKHKNRIQIRARSRAHLVQLRRDHELVSRSVIHELDNADFQFRMVITRWRWEALAAELSRAVDYVNLEAVIVLDPRMKSMVDELQRVGEMMRRFQRRMHPVDPMKGEPKLFPEPENLDDLLPKQ